MDLHVACNEVVAMGANTLIVSLDTQVELPAGIDGLTGLQAHVARSQSTDEACRVNEIFEWMSKWSLRAASTWLSTGDRRSWITRRPWGRDRADGRQIDHIFTP